MATRVRQGPKGLRIVPRTRLKAGVRYDEVEEAFIGYAPALNIYSQANSEDAAKKTLERTITLFLGAACSNYVLIDALATAGFGQGHRKADENSEDECICGAEEALLEQQKFNCIFEVPASLPVESPPVS